MNDCKVAEAGQMRTVNCSDSCHLHRDRRIGSVDPDLPVPDRHAVSGPEGPIPRSWLEASSAGPAPRGKLLAPTASYPPGPSRSTATAPSPRLQTKQRAGAAECVAGIASVGGVEAKCAYNVLGRRRTAANATAHNYELSDTSSEPSSLIGEYPAPQLSPMLCNRVHNDVWSHLDELRANGSSTARARRHSLS